MCEQLIFDVSVSDVLVDRMEQDQMEAITVTTLRLSFMCQVVAKRTLVLPLCHLSERCKIASALLAETPKDPKARLLRFTSTQTPIRSQDYKG